MAGPCRDCVSGSVTTEAPKGSETVLHGLPTYVAKPLGESTGIVVILPDAFGWQAPNNRVLADRYARKGHYTVYLPEFMNGHAAHYTVMAMMDEILAPGSSWFHTLFVKPFLIVQVMLQLVPFMYFCRRSVCKPRVLAFFRALRTSPETADEKIGVAGFCWGGQHVVMLASDAPSTRVHRPRSEKGELQSLIDAAFTAHPSFVKAKDTEGVRIPLSIAIGNTDMSMNIKEVEGAKAILEKKRDGEHEVVIIPGAQHGFAVRGNPSDEEQQAQADQAEEQALRWYKQWLR